MLELRVARSELRRRASVGKEGKRRSRARARKAWEWGGV